MRISDWSSDVCSSDLSPRLDVALDLAIRIGLPGCSFCRRSEESRVGKECVVRVDLGGRRIIKKKKRTAEGMTIKHYDGKKTNNKGQRKQECNKTKQNIQNKNQKNTTTETTIQT